MKRRTFVALAGAAMLQAAAVGSVSAQQKMVLKASDVHPLGYPTVEAVTRMGKKLEAATNGRLSIQTNPAFYRNAQAIAQQAIHFNNLAPNMQVKIPVTEAGITAIEEATFHGVSVNATVCFTVAQAVAVAKAIERGLDRRAASGRGG